MMVILYSIKVLQLQRCSRKIPRVHVTGAARYAVPITACFGCHFIAIRDSR